jgi:hypothetical protein
MRRHTAGRLGTDLVRYWAEVMALPAKWLPQTCRLLGVLPLLLLLAPVFGLSVASGQGYSFHHDGAETGLGNSTILSLLQDHTGFIWVGTEAGLA